MNKNIIYESVQSLLFCEEDFMQMRESVHQLYDIFSKITGITVDDFNVDKDIMLPEGKAISSIGAAHCLLEMKRTAVFLRGIQKAIVKKLSQKKSIRILYAGTGPYGTLVIPLLLLYKPEDICVDLIDINPRSLEALEKIINELGLNKYIGDTYCLDASKFIVKNDYDIAISETMQSCLKNEPQVAIMQNLIPQMPEGCIFIPENISIDAYLTNPRMEQDRLLSHPGDEISFRRIALGNVMQVNKNYLTINEKEKRLAIPIEKEAFPVLKLFTTVKVFENAILRENDSSITMPIQFHDFRQKDATQIEFWYTQGEKPQIESRIGFQQKKDLVF